MALAIQASKTLSKDQLCLLEPIPEACGIVIFGASGDLTQRKLLPALFHLACSHLMPRHYYILGVARTEMSDDAFRQKVKASLPVSAPKDQIDAFVARCRYVFGDYNQAGLYRLVGSTLSEMDRVHGVAGHRVFYLSTPPSVYADIVARLGQAGLTKMDPQSDVWSRVIIEKPFGQSLPSSQELNRAIRGVLHENQIYRIDHYLAKETVQNILMFRFANILFEPVWHRNFVDHIQITAAEQIGIEHRAGYYEQAGVIRDMFQNHLLQVLSLIAMEPPASLNADAVRSRRSDVLRAIPTMAEEQVLRNTVCAQYIPGLVKGGMVSGYREEEGVSATSRIATYAAMKLELDNWRWQGVPFYIRAGKRLSERSVTVSVYFKRVPTSIFKPLLADQLSPNVLRFKIQPDEGISMQFEAKHPGPKLCMSTVNMDFNYQDTFTTPQPEAYARLFQDAMLGDQTLFARSDQVEESWRVVDPIINMWEQNSQLALPTYPAGSWGPTEADALMARDGRQWD